ncbi:hypothetical protein Zmor_010157 [Zophobas morio]|uniref:Uncharacterized protein n=1 Tax=Zophobas morio TaxID=2755281 RepID=A0AA38MJD8_9CUCU|nr:hypothetical protein Zmor_010157 [Zophobas morio]
MHQVLDIASVQFGRNGFGSQEIRRLAARGRLHFQAGSGVGGGWGRVPTSALRPLFAPWRGDNSSDAQIGPFECFFSGRLFLQSIELRAIVHPRSR